MSCKKLFSIIKPTVTALMNMTSWAVSRMSVPSCKTRLIAAHDFYLSFKASLILSEKSFDLREIVKREYLVCSTTCFSSGHAYSVNIVKQFFINSLSNKGTPFLLLTQNSKLSSITSSESFL